MPYDRFDAAGPPTGWRALLSSGCVDAAAALLEAYRARHGARLSEAQRAEMSFHIGQVYALGGRDADSLPHFQAALWPGASEEWRAYVAATVAFLRKDRAALEAAISAYGSVPGSGRMRLAIVRQLLACLERPYAEAVRCGGAH